MKTLITDQAGRKIALRPIGVLDTLRLFRALGGELSENRAYVNLATIIASVEMIDGVPVPFPASVGALEALVARIGDENIAAIAAAHDDDNQHQDLANAGN